VGRAGCLYGQAPKAEPDKEQSEAQNEHGDDDPHRLNLALLGLPRGLYGGIFHDLSLPVLQVIEASMTESVADR
jgi:hypothetical protein